jgi:ankyrin repeat protein
MLLAKQGVDVNQAMNDGSTPLFIASQNRRSEVVSMLLAKQGVDVNQAMNDGATPLLIASW